jgi:hypothetical protein
VTGPSDAKTLIISVFDIVSQYRLPSLVCSCSRSRVLELTPLFSSFTPVFVVVFSSA